MLHAHSFYPLFAQREEDVAMLVMVVVIAVFVLVGLGIACAILYFLHTCYDRIPPRHRAMEPWQVWLTLIPCFGIVWIFFVYPGLAKSYRNYFYEQGRTDVGDCGEQLAWWYCGLTVASCIPYLGACFGLAALIVWIIFLVKAGTLKGQIPVGAAEQPLTDQGFQDYR